MPPAPTAADGAADAAADAPDAADAAVARLRRLIRLSRMFGEPALDRWLGPCMELVVARPFAPEPHRLLGDLYVRGGRTVRAERCYARAAALQGMPGADGGRPGA